MDTMSCSPQSSTVELFAVLTNAANVLEAASVNVVEAALIMQGRTAFAVSRTHDASETIVAAVIPTQAAVLSRARTRLRMLVDKLLTERSEETDANARLLDAVASMRDVRQLPALFMRDVDSLSLALMLRGDGVSSMVICTNDVSIAVASHWAVMHRDAIDASMSEVSGPGTVGFVRRDSAQRG